jgi:hypothetical protein
MNLRILCILLLPLTATAQDQISPVHNQTTPPTDARFEIVQAQTAAKWTFRLDRYTGRIWQLVKTRTDNNAWEETRVIGTAKTTSGSRPHFQLFLSGLAAKHTFLIDVDTGRSWTLTTLTDDKGKAVEIVWTPFED